MNVAQDKIVHLLKIFFFFAYQFSLVFVYLMCGSRQLFFQCGPETPKGWTPLVEILLLRVWFDQYSGVNTAKYFLDVKCPPIRSSLLLF